MGGIHVDDVFRGGPGGGALEIKIPADLPKELRRQIAVDRIRLILVNLASRANERNLAYPSFRTIAEETGIQERKVRVGLQILERIGWITRVAPARSGRRGITYHLNLPSVIGGPDYTRDSGSNAISNTRSLTEDRTENCTDVRTVSSTPECSKQEQDHVKEKHLRSEVDFCYGIFQKKYPSGLTNGEARIAFNAAVNYVAPAQILADLDQELVSLGQVSSESLPMARDWLNARYTPRRALG